MGGKGKKNSAVKTPSKQYEKGGEKRPDNGSTTTKVKGKTRSAVKPPSKQSGEGGEDTLVKAFTSLEASTKLSFEHLPTEIRLQIYRELLLGGKRRKSPAILACNKKIHDEAAGVLYGENLFMFPVFGLFPYRLWHGSLSPGSAIWQGLPRHYSRLISKVHLVIGLHDWEWKNCVEDLTISIRNLSASIRDRTSELTLNDLQLLSMNFAAPTHIPMSVAQSAWVRARQSDSQHCFGPLLKARATRFELKGSLPGKGNRAMAAKLKSTIESPKDETFFSCRLQKQEEDKRDPGPWPGTRLAVV